MLCVSSDLSAVVGVVFRGVRVGHVPQMQLKSRHEKSGLARIAEMCIAESKYTPRLGLCRCARWAITRDSRITGNITGNIPGITAAPRS